MKRLLWLWAVSCSLFVAGCGSKDGASPGSDATVPSVKAQPAGGAWQVFRSPDARFAVSMPGTAEKLPSDPGESRFGLDIEGGGGYTLLFTDYEEVKPEDLDGHLTTLRDNAVQKQKVLLDEKSQVGKVPARDFAYVDEEGDAQFYRVVIVGNRLYQLTRVVSEADFGRDEANRRKFVDSFELSE